MVDEISYRLKIPQMDNPATTTLPMLVGGMIYLLMTNVYTKRIKEDFKVHIQSKYKLVGR